MHDRPLKPWQRRASPLSRQGLLCLILLIAYASLYPFTFQRAAVGPFDYLFAPLPRYMTMFDVVTNVLGYIPLGVMTVLALHPVWRGTRAVLAALALGALLSCGMEALQTYLPTRVASNVDLATNAVGALIGGALAVPLTSPLLDRGWLRQLRFAWFERHASVLLVLLALWPWAQAYPQQFLFGDGDLVRQIWLWQDPDVTDTVLDWVPRLADLQGYLSDLDAVASHVLWETVVTASGTIVAGLLLTLSLRRAAPRVALLGAMFVVAFAVKSSAAALQFSPAQAFDWVTPGAVYGLVVGGALLMALAWGPRTLRGIAVFAALLVMLVLVNLLPANPYYESALQMWRQGQYVHFNVLARWLAWTWPYLVLFYLMAMFDPSHRGPARDVGRQS
ncbi:teicoplanin resistance protein VanZ [Pandoraea terrae]|uniref:Teicoplanin resistance protein VanZ n=1 Tax=Pandoraea terrae TaxID=1537710 RepID=A0A5E4YED3_9BURK|nr:VanZ family protein [Pandoraea terrae]VVE46797.1 teicoplanin resistance protein VanZ [Pandoraea terrae]